MELKQCPIVDKNQVPLYLMQEQSIKALVATGKYKEDTLLLPLSISKHFYKYLVQCEYSCSPPDIEYH